MDSRVTFNVSGTKFEVEIATILKYPDSKLAKLVDPESVTASLPDDNGEYFIDRNARLFEVVLDYYRQGKVNYPPDLTRQSVDAELIYYELKGSIDKESIEDIADIPELEEQLQKATNTVKYQKASEMVLHSDSGIVHKGVNILLELLKAIDPLTERTQEDITIMTNIHYYLAVGYHRLGDSTETKKHLTLCPNGNALEVKTLQVLSKDTSRSFKAIGMVTLATAAVCLGGLTSFLLMYATKKRN